MEIYNCSKLRIFLSLFIHQINCCFGKTFQVWSIYEKKINNYVEQCESYPGFSELFGGGWFAIVL